MAFFSLLVSICLLLTQTAQQTYGKKALPKNLALGKLAYQSSSFQNNDARLAVDGDKNPEYEDGSCTHTLEKRNSWWAVDLEAAHYIQSVNVTNRITQKQRLSHIRICVTTKSTEVIELNDCAMNIPDTWFEGTKLFSVDRHGRYVVIINAAYNFLTLCEVEVFGFLKRPNLALGKNASQSSNYNFNDPNVALDGNHNPWYDLGSCTHTNEQYKPWWVVDLGHVYYVRYVAVTNSLEYGLDFNKLVLGASTSNKVPMDQRDRCGRTWEGFTGTKLFPCIPDREARYIIISNEFYSFLTLCEVEVYGFLKPTNLALYQDIMQSTINNSNPTVASDGDKSIGLVNSICTSTFVEVNPWLMVILETAYFIRSVTIYNNRTKLWVNGEVDEMNVTYRGEIGWRLPLEERLTIGVFSDSPDITLRYINICAHKEWPITEKGTLPCGEEGNRVIITNRATGILSLCEVEIFGFIKADNELKPTEVNLALNRRAYQSSNAPSPMWVDDLGVAALAVDGNKDTELPAMSCSYTNKQADPWWTVDLRRRYVITKVVITNRGGTCCTSALSDFFIGASYDQLKKDEVYKVGFQFISLDLCHRQTEALGAGETRAFECLDITRGRYVFIVLWKTDVLALCEVEVYGYREHNLALNKPVHQSSNLNNSTGAMLAVDGDMYTGWAAGTCAQTMQEKNPWWTVDLLHHYYIDEVVLTIGGFCCYREKEVVFFLTGITRTSITEDPETTLEVCAPYNNYAMDIGESRGFKCRRTARYVLVTDSSKKVLSLCEVEIFGIRYMHGQGQVEGQVAPQPYGTEVNIALHQRTYQSSHHISESSDSGLAVDGIIQEGLPPNSCTSTDLELEMNPWWAVDLILRHVVTKVVMTSFGVSRNFVVGASYNNPTTFTPSNTTMALCSRQVVVGGTETQSFECSSITRGSYVIIQLQLTVPDVLSLCEVEVYGYPVDNLALHKPAHQSSIKRLYWARLATDGNRDTEFLHESCSLTLQESNPWLAVDLQHHYYVDEVVLTSRADLQEYQTDLLGELRIGITYTTAPEGHPVNKMDVCAYKHDKMQLGESLGFKCGRYGRYVIVNLNTTYAALSLCEVEVYGVRNDLGEVEVYQNLARGKHANQSSNSKYNDNPGVAVDGNDSPSFETGSCSMTGREENPWWAVDLETSYMVLVVDVTNRDYKADYLNYIVIGVTNTNPTEVAPTVENINVCASKKREKVHGTELFKCNEEGRYVVIINNKDSYLTLCEVKVTGFVGMCSKLATWLENNGFQPGVETRYCDSWTCNGGGLRAEPHDIKPIRGDPVKLTCIIPESAITRPSMSDPTYLSLVQWRWYKISNKADDEFELMWAAQMTHDGEYKINSAGSKYMGHLIEGSSFTNLNSLHLVHELSFSNVQEFDDGNYFCSVRHAYRNDKKRVDAKYQDPEQCFEWSVARSNNVTMLTQDLGYTKDTTDRDLMFYKLRGAFEEPYCYTWNCYRPILATQHYVWLRSTDSAKFTCKLGYMDPNLTSDFQLHFVQIRWYKINELEQFMLMFQAQINSDGEKIVNAASREYKGRLRGSTFKTLDELKRSHELTFLTLKASDMLKAGDTGNYFCSVNYGFYSEEKESATNDSKFEDYYKWFVARSNNFTMTIMDEPCANDSPVCYEHGQCADMGRGRECLCHKGWMGTDCSVVDTNPRFLQVDVPYAPIMELGSDMTLPCSFSLQAGSWDSHIFELMWYATYNAEGFHYKKSTLFRGLFHAPKDGDIALLSTKPYEHNGEFWDNRRYTRNNMSLVVEDYRGEGIRQICCVVTLENLKSFPVYAYLLDDPGIVFKTEQGCFKPVYVDFPRSALVCKLENGGSIQNGSTITETDPELVTCSYEHVKPRVGLQVTSTVVGDGLETIIANKTKDEAVKTSDDHYAMMIQFMTSIEKDTLFRIKSVGVFRLDRVFVFQVASPSSSGMKKLSGNGASLDDNAIPSGGK